jgi:hypothetical protein
MTMWEGFALSRLAIVLIDQLRQIYIEGELELIDTTRYYPKIMRQEYTRRRKPISIWPSMPRPARRPMDSAFVTSVHND